MSDISSSIPPMCAKCKEEFDTRYSINEVVEHFNKHLDEEKED